MKNRTPAEGESPDAQTIGKAPAEAMVAGGRVPVWQLYGERATFPDHLHCETIVERAAGHDWQIAPHVHLHLHQFFLLVSGDIRLTLAGEEVAMVPPVMLSVPRGVAHGFRFSAGTEGYVITLPAEEFPDIFGAESELAALLTEPLIRPAGPALIARGEAMAEAHRRARDLRRSILHGEALLLVSAFLTAGQDEVRPDALHRPARPPHLDRFEELMRQHLRSGWGVAEYAAAIGVSPRHLGRIMQAAYGQPARAVLAAAQIREACRLLAYTRMPVQQVGFALGFDDPAYFSRVFGRVTGMTPSAYRGQLDGAG